MAAPSLGLFAKLPVEIRLLIWDEFLLSGWKRGGSKTDLSILRTSKQLHYEIQDYLHQKMSMVTFIVRPEFDEVQQIIDSATHLSFEMWVGSDYIKAPGTDDDDYDERLIRSPRWTFASAQDALSRGLQYLPLHKLSTVVCIEPPDPEDPGQVICLCLRLQQLVELLRGMKRPICRLAVRFGDPKKWIMKTPGEVENEGQEEETREQQIDPNFNIERWWAKREEQGESGEEEERVPDLNISLDYPSTLAETSFMDSDIAAVMFPIYRLDNIEMIFFDVSAGKLLWPKSRLPFKVLPIIMIDAKRMKLRDLTPHGFPADLTPWNDMYNYYLHSRLDAVEGPTGRLLRLDRFARWKEFKYDEMFLRLLKKYPYQLETLDAHQLVGLRYRYLYAHLLRHYIIGKTIEDLPLDIDLRTIAPNISPHDWSDTFLGGLPPFNNHVVHVEQEDLEFWWKFSSYDSKQRDFLEDLRSSRHKSSPGALPASFDAFTNAIADAQDEVRSNSPAIDDRLEEFGIRPADPIQLLFNTD